MTKKLELVFAFMLLCIALPSMAQEIPVDGNTIFLLRFDGNVNGEQGEGSYSSDTYTFTSGLQNQGIFINGGTPLTYDPNGNLTPSAGTVEFWVKPNCLLVDNDLSISYIQRIPEMDYVWDSNNPAVEGWPTVGQQITWRAVVKNWMSEGHSVQYRWFEDDVELFNSTIFLPGNSTTNIDLPWNWTFDRHRLRLEIDATNVVEEFEESNNSLEIFTDAISVGFYVEQDLYDFFHENQFKLGVGANTWEDWANRQVNMWNDMFANAIYPETPNGVLDRIRLDKVTIVGNGALPLAGGLPGNHPNYNDRSVDLIWGFPSTVNYSDVTTVSTNNHFFYEGSLIHELGHARYLVDAYGFNTSHNPDAGNNIAIEECGELVAGSSLMPFQVFDITYLTKYQGLMASDYTYVDRYSAVAMNLIAGHRATLGNYNAPGNIGEFMNDFPTQNELTVKNMDGDPLPGANIKVYQATNGTGWYNKHFDNTFDLEFTADANGVVQLGICPFDDDGTIEHTYGISNAIAIVRVQYGSLVGYGFLESADFNMEYWRGNTGLGTYELQLDMQSVSCILPIELTQFNGYHKAGNNHLFWETATETNNKKFIIERSDNQHFFEAIGEMAGRSLSNQPHKYQFKDSAPLEGINYYRLLQIDQNGTTSYSETIAIEVEKAGVVSLYPNPFQSELYVQIPFSTASSELQVTNLAGQIIFQTIIPSATPRWTLNTEDWPQGLYWIEIQQEGSILRGNVVK